MKTAPNRQFNYWASCFGATIIVLFYCGSVVGQSVSPSVRNTSGEDFLMEQKQFAFSIGEAAITTLQSGDVIVTQGFLQPEIQSPCVGLRLRYFPNPVTNYLTVLDADCGALVARIQIFDLFGKLILSSELQNRSTDLSLLGFGVFIVRAYTDQNQAIGSFKMVKVSD